MKGFMIYETPLWGDEENTVYLQEVKNASYTLKKIGSDDITGYLEANWLKPLLVSGIPRVKVNNHKVVYWENVR